MFYLQCSCHNFSQSKLVLMLYLGILHGVIIGWWLGAILLHRINLCIHHCVGTRLCNFRWRLCVDEYILRGPITC